MTIGYYVHHPKNIFTRFIIWLYDRPAYHWIISVPLAPLDTLFGLVYRALNAIWPIKYWQEWQSWPEPHFPLPKTADDLPVNPEACDACGKYLGTLIGTYVDSQKLAALLPEDMSLDPVHIHENQHAVVLLFGYTQDLHRAWWHLPGMSYLEFLIGIPNIRFDRDRGYVSPFFFLPVLHLDRFYPTLLGWLVGYKKRWSRISAQENTYSISTLFTGQKILDATFIKRPVDAMVKPQDWEQLLNEPHITVFGDSNLFLHFHWDWEHKIMEPVDVELTVYEDIPGFSAGKYSFKGIEEQRWHDTSAPEGAVRFCVPFELLAPFSRKVLDESQEKAQAATAV